MATSSSSTSSFSTYQHKSDRHFNYENWPSLSFLEDLDEEDVEVTKASAFDPVVGKGRTQSTRSSSARSSGSTGFYESVEMSPTNSLSPHAFDQYQDSSDENALSQVMFGLNIGGPSIKTSHVEGPTLKPQIQQSVVSFNTQQALANLMALSALSNTGAGTSGALFEPHLSRSGSSQPSIPNASDNIIMTSNNLMTTTEHAQMQIRCKFGTLGEFQGQFQSPHGFCMGRDEEIVAADTYNHRIQIFDKNGNFKYMFGVPGKDEGMLWYPRKVAVLRDSGNFVICDRGNERSRMQIFSPSGHFIRRIPIRFIDIVAGLAISREGHIVAVDSVTPTIFILSENGDLIRYIECSDHMTEPSDIAIFNHEYYICDFKGHSVVVMHENGTFLRRIGSRPVTNFPNGIDISDAGDILVGDSHGNQFHVAVYDRRGELISNFVCPQVKVSRCCGLKITSEGYIVTLAKNNHHVLVLNTLYVP